MEPRRIVGARTVDDGSTMGRHYYVDNYGQYWEPHSGGSTVGTGQDVRVVGRFGELGYPLTYKKPEQKAKPIKVKHKRRRERERRQKKGRGR